MRFTFWSYFLFYKSRVLTWVISKALLALEFYGSTSGTLDVSMVRVTPYPKGYEQFSMERTSNVPHSKQQAVPTDRNHYSPPSWMTIEFTVASEVRRSISPCLITTCFAESCPGSQFLRRGFWSGQFSVRQCNINIPPIQQNGRIPLAKPKHYHHVLQSEINGLTSFNFLP